MVPTTANGVPLSGWWWRALAITIDGLIVGVLAGLIASPIYVKVFGQMSEYISRVVEATERGLPAPPQPTPESLISFTDNLIVIAVSVAVQSAYIIAFLRWRSATPGKLITGLRVVPVEQGRFPGPLPWSTIIIRVVVWVLPAIASVLLLFRLIDVLFPLWQPRRQALHDLAARTQVVKIR